MKLEAIRLSAVGPFRQGVAIEGIARGLNVWVAPNETGKSTLFRALTLAFREKHTSRNKLASALQPMAGGSPTVEIDFEADGRAWRLTKRWFGGQTALLLDRQTNTLLRNADAETRLADLLSNGVDRASLSGVLWVDQAPAQPLPVAAGSVVSVLSDLVEREISEAAGSGRAREVRLAVARRLDTLMTPARKGPKTGTEYGRAVKEAEALKAKLEAAEARAASALGRMHRLAAVRDDLAALDDPEATHRRVADRDDAARKLAEARQAAAEHEKARHAMDAANALAAQASAAHGQFTKALADLALRRQRAGLIAVDLAAAEAGATAADQQRRASEAALARANEDVDRARARLAAARAAEEQNAHALAHERLQQRLAVAVRAAREAEKAEAMLASIDMPGIEALRALLAEQARLAAEARAGAPVIDFRLDPSAAGRVTIAGRSIEAGSSFVADHPVEINVAGIGVIAVRQGGEAAEALSRRREATAAAIRSQMTKLAVASAEDAEHLAAAAREALERRRESRAVVAAQAPEGLAALEREVAAMAARVSAGPVVPVDATGTPEDLQTSLADAEVARKAADLEDRANMQRLAEATASLAALRARREREAAEIAQLEASLPPEAERTSAVEDLKRKLDEANRRREDAALVVEAWRKRDPGSDIIRTLEAEATRTAAVLETAAKQREGLRREADQIEGALWVDGATGSAAEPEEIGAELATVEVRVAAFAREAAALQLLDRVLAEVEAEDRTAVSRPVRRRLESYAGRLLPGIEVLLGEGFAIESVQRFEASEPATRLSIGTIEQIGLMTRLAYARLLADSGHPVPVILDDPLAHADDDRLARTFEVLAEAATHHQIVVLSCHASFAALAETNKARCLRIEPWNSSI